MNFEDLTEEQKNKARECKTFEELVAFAEAEGIELSEEQLDAMSGGIDWNCPLIIKDCDKYESPCRRKVCATKVTF